MPSGVLERLRLRSSVRDIKKPSLWVAVIAELLGTMFLVFFGCASLLPSADRTIVGFAFGLSLATVVWIFGDVSGGQVNPAVTLAMLLTRRVSLARALLYVVAQMVGSIIGSALNEGLLKSKVTDITCVTQVAAGYSGAQAFGVELFATSILVLTVFSAFDGARRQSGSGALAIGLALVLGHLSFFNITGPSMNPARSFGPALLANNFKQHWVYWVGPLTGGLLGGFCYEFLVTKRISLARARQFVTRASYDPDESLPTEYQSFPLNNEENE